VKAEAHRNSLSVNCGRLEEECAGLRTAANMLRQEKTEVVAPREAEITTIRTKFQDYRVCHRKKLHEFQTNLEKEVNKLGVKCLLYPVKNSTIGEVVGWLDKEIKPLPAAIVKANKNFICYCVVGVLRMLYENGCNHVEGL
jgi:hypothetical protein